MSSGSWSRYARVPSRQRTTAPDPFEEREKYPSRSLRYAGTWPASGYAPSAERMGAGRTSDARIGDVPQLETPRLRLRAWGEHDVPEYACILRDPEVMRYLGSGLRYALKRKAASLVASVSDVEARRGIRKLAAHWSRCGFGEWAVEDKASGELIGQIGLHHHPDWVADPAKVEVGWLLARRAWGRGFATEGARASLAYAFDRLAMDRIVSISLLPNVRSQWVMERLGLSRVGQTRWKGSEVVWYAIDRAAWKGETP